METEQIATIEESAVEQTTPDVEETSQPDETQTIEETTQEPETTETETTATDEGEKVTDWEKIAKDNQASFTKISQEKAELSKRIEELESRLKPKIVQEGKINPQYEQKYRLDVDNREFLTYDSLARQLEPEQREEVENLLREAKTLYNPNNTRAYEQKMSQIKDYFRSDLVEQIATEKQSLLNQMNSEFEKAVIADKQERANKVAQEIEKEPEIYELVNPESEKYSPEIFGIVKQMFELTGGIDIDATKRTISAIKDLGVKEYIAKQTAEKEKAQATVPTGETVVQKSENLPTATEVSQNYEKYIQKYQKQGLSFNDAMAKVDEIIMKG